jgi:CubicO group peptidase (beta-lactamase class C family)
VSGNSPEPAQSADDFARRFPSAAEVVLRGIQRGFHRGAQICISQHGTVLADVGLGFATPDRPMTNETVNPWLSAGKPLTAVVIAQLREAGRLDWDDPVARHIPEFASRGKEGIAIRHLLTHTAGLGRVDAGWPQATWEESIARICAAELDAAWVAGESAAYDPRNSWFLLGEIIQRITQLPFSQALTRKLLAPAGMNRTWAALAEEEYVQRSPQLGWMWERDRGELALLPWHEATYCTRPSPGSSLRGPIRELARFYEILLNGGVGPHGPVLSQATIAELVARQRHGKFDQTFGHVVDFGLGFLLDSNHYANPIATYGYGELSSPRTFGHGGAQSSQGYCDPERGLVVAYVFNGRPGEGQHQRRAKQLNDAISRDLANFRRPAG